MTVRSTHILAVAGVAALVGAAYANHFQNGFHFDDSHAILDNPFVRDLGHLPRYFSDATTFSVLPQNQSYRPVLQATLAVDYWLAGGYVPWVFQLDTFCWFVAQLVAMWRLFRRAVRLSAPDENADYAALAAVAVFAVHPVGAETVNYVIQRGEILSTLGVVTALWMYADSARARRWGIWVLPLALGILSKPPALIFPALLALWIVVIERPATPSARREAWTSVAIAITVTLLAAWWLASHTPSSHVTGASSPLRYVLSQPWVTLRYLGAFVAPIDLSADNDWALVDGWADARVWLGLLAVAGLVWLAARTGRRCLTAPIAFGIGWFLIALLPTALTPLAEVANDHRMYFPFVGLALAVVWGAWLLVQHGPVPSGWRRAALPILVAVLVVEGVGVNARNRVWRSDESLWRDVTLKSPTNGRGLMNYGLALMARGDYAAAIDLFERALVFTPNYALLHVNLGIAYGGMKRTADAERAFQTAQRLAPDDWRSHYYLARWLGDTGRIPEAVIAATRAVQLNAADQASRMLLARLNAAGAAATAAAAADELVTQSLAQHRAGQFRESLASAQAALRLRPDYAAAWNNAAAAHIAMGEYDQGIVAAEAALRLDATMQIARNNLAYALEQKARQASRPPAAGSLPRG